MPCPTPDLWTTWGTQLLSGLVGALIGAVASLGTTVFLEKWRFANVRGSVRRQLLLLMESARGRFDSVRRNANMYVVIYSDPATKKLLDLAFEHDAVMALTDSEAHQVQEAALRAERVASSYVENDQRRTTGALTADIRETIQSAAQDAIQLLDKAIAALGGPLRRA